MFGTAMVLISPDTVEPKYSPGSRPAIGGRYAAEASDKGYD